MSKAAPSIRKGLSEAVAYAKGRSPKRDYRVHVPGHVVVKAIRVKLGMTSVARIPTGIDLESILIENGSMKTTVDIPEDELKDAMRFTKAKTKREAVVKVLEDFNRRRRMAELVKYSGSFSDRFPTNEDIEAIDAPRSRTLNGRPRR
jgi:Arc/MetJ family transcription regulator